MNIGITNPIISQSNVLQKQSCNGISSGSLKSINNTIKVSFTGNPAKHLNQIASISAEYQGLIDELYKLGGVGNVTHGAAVAFQDIGGADIRTFIPYYSPDNESGGVKVKTPLYDKDGNRVQWRVPQRNGQIKTIDAYRFKSVPIDYKLRKDEAYVIHDFVSKEKPWTTKYVELEKTGIYGSVDTIKKDLSGMEDVPYYMFKVKGTDYNKVGNPAVYIIHTPDTAKFSRAYTPNKDSDLLDISYSKTYRAILDLLPKMDTKEFGNYNPASFWLHDWHTFSMLPIMAEKSSSGDEYFNGLRIHSTLHNAGRDFFQGHYNNPIEFFRLIGSENDLKSLQNHPDFDFVNECEKKIRFVKDDGRQKDISEVLSKNDISRLCSIFDSIIGNFKDEYGEYNMCEIAIEGVRKNPQSMTLGTVSGNYGEEIKIISEMADGLTTDLVNIPTIDIINGSEPGSLKLNEIGNFGKNNGFELLMEENFKPLTDDVINDSSKLISTKEENKKFLINTIADAVNEGNDSVKRLFFNKKQLSDGCTILGGLSEYKEGDVLFFGWGRPTEQKGFPTSIEAVKQYLMSDAPEEDKMHAKFIFGGGPWNQDKADYKAIEQGIKEIEELDGGKYKGQIIYVNGRISNRMVACADYAMFTSISEPCGMTPFEAYEAGTPVISNRTGGAPNFVISYNGHNADKSTGFLTEHPFFVSPAELKLKNISQKELTEARIKLLGNENAESIKLAMKLRKTNSYKTMVSNCIKLNIGWDKNNTFNGGKSSMDKYFEDVWNIDKDFNELVQGKRVSNPLESLKGKMAVDTYSRCVA